MSRRGESTREHILEKAEGLIMYKGYAGTSIDDVLGETGLTKGAFFYHFKNKNELAQALVERFWKNDLNLFNGFSKRANELSEDPLQNLLIFLKLFEEYINALEEPPPGCMFASYLYEQYHFNENIKKFINQAFSEWKNMFRSRLRKIQEKYPSQNGANIDELSDMIMSLIEGGFILAKSYNDGNVISRQVAQFRNYLKLLFNN